MFKLYTGVEADRGHPVSTVSKKRSRREGKSKSYNQTLQSCGREKKVQYVLKYGHVRLAVVMCEHEV